MGLGGGVNGRGRGGRRWNRNYGNGRIEAAGPVHHIDARREGN